MTINELPIQIIALIAGLMLTFAVGFMTGFRP